MDKGATFEALIEQIKAGFGKHKKDYALLDYNEIISEISEALNNLSNSIKDILTDREKIGFIKLKDATAALLTELFKKPASNPKEEL